MSKDPFDFVAHDMNTYRLARSNPSSLVDPSGAIPIDCECADPDSPLYVSTERTECGGLVENCGEKACRARYWTFFTGNWSVVGAAPNVDVPAGTDLSQLGTINGLVTVYGMLH